MHEHSFPTRRSSDLESKIGLTMRQPGLGKHEWIIEDQNKASAGGE
jgi:DNA-directed RNA polymerase subunit E'/Rpb7